MRPVGRTLGIAGLLALCGHATAQEQRGTAPGAFDFYVLALSWSPGFCKTNERAAEREQCAVGSGLGFVVHGLWPQNERGFPAFCEPGSRFVSRAAVDAAENVFPDEGLARYQWRKHGVCSGLSPTEYFAATAKVRKAITIPPQLNASPQTQRWAPLDIERAFVAANPGLRTDMMSVTCRRDVFQEVRICLSKDLRGFRTCPQVDRAGCRTSDIEVSGSR